MLAFLPLGCAAATPGYAARRLWIHKDVVVLSIYLDEKLPVEGYRRIVEIEMAKLRSAAVASESEIPLYEVRFEFCLPGASTLEGRLASVSVRPADDGDATPPTITVY